ncbi:unnamed protein product [Rhizophagus irregularis]|nr:unnamed protein product [Rhizophagus irregularis]
MRRKTYNGSYSISFHVKCKKSKLNSLSLILFSNYTFLLRVLDIFKSVVKVLTVIIQYNSPKFYPAFARFRLAS